MQPVETPRARSWLRWPLRILLLVVLLILGATTLARDSATLLVVFIFLLLLVGIPLALWRRRLGTAEITAVLAGTTLLFALCVRYLYLEPMRCALPPGYPYAVTFERSGEVAGGVQGAVSSDDGSISISFSAQARSEANYVPVKLHTLDEARLLPNVAPEQLRNRSLYVVEGYWTSAGTDANTAMTAGQIKAWRLPVFARNDDDLTPLGDLTGSITLPVESRVKDTPYRLLGMRPGQASDTAKKERGRYHPDRLVERVLRTGRPAHDLNPERVHYQQCRPAWWMTK